MTHKTKVLFLLVLNVVGSAWCFVNDWAVIGAYCGVAAALMFILLFLED